MTATDDPEGARIVGSAPLVGVAGLTGCRISRVYHLDGEIDHAAVTRLCAEVLVDPVVDVAFTGAAPPPEGRAVEVAPMAGVTDTDARELERAATQLGLPAIQVSTARRFDLIGNLDDTDVATITHRLLANDTIERSTEGELAPIFAGEASVDVRVDEVILEGLSDD